MKQQNPKMTPVERIETLVAALNREARANGYTSLTVTIRPEGDPMYTAVVTEDSITQQILPMVRTPHLRETPELLQGICQEDEAAFCRVLEMVFDQGYTDFAIASSTTPQGVWEGTEPHRVAMLVLHRSKHCLSGLADVARKRGISVDELLASEGIPEANRPIPRPTEAETPKPLGLVERHLEGGAE